MKFLDRIFGHDPIHVGPETVDWVPGDIAECINDRFCVPDGDTGQHPRKGRRYIVKTVQYGISYFGDCKFFALGLFGPFEHEYISSSFKKIVLDDINEEDEFDKRVPVREMA